MKSYSWAGPSKCSCLFVPTFYPFRPLIQHRAQQAAQAQLECVSTTVIQEYRKLRGAAEGWQKETHLGWRAPLLHIRMTQAKQRLHAAQD